MKNKLMKFKLLKDFILEGSLTCHVTGSCMDRPISPGSEVRLARKHPWWPGDIVTCKRGDDELVSHRLLGYLPGRGGWKVITRADTAKVADQPVPIHHVLGSVTHLDGKPYRPGPGIRVRALTAWFPAVLRWLINRLVAAAQPGQTT